MEPKNSTSHATPHKSSEDMVELALLIKEWGQQLGFQQVGITDVHLDEHEQHLLSWLKQGLHGEMAYMSRHGNRRSRPDELVKDTIRVISVRMDYLPPESTAMTRVLNDPQRGYVSRYALGRDYHKMLRQRIQSLATRIEKIIGQFGYRAFVDSAPVLEKALAQKAGLGWIGKHTNLINREAGSWFFLGELYTDLPLPVDTQTDNHCGSCNACIDVCPTAAIIGPYRLDARRCISYLTIELDGAIPVEFRPLIGNRIYGCDDCQMVCPWNRFAQHTGETDFHPRHQLDNAALTDLFAWSEQEFLDYTTGSAIRRIGHQSWLRNIAVALGNALKALDSNSNNTAIRDRLIAALQSRAEHSSPIVREHVQWALQQS